MPEALESLLWCAALATWLMILFRIVGEHLKPAAKLLGHLVEAAFRYRMK
ncbi:hypothetical protein ACFQZO_04255 [Bradyrhizobium sp. GCM10027634]|nr:MULTISPECIES: hypothetical protein [unclassified Bradyrhizobium]MDN5000094.1 hypothetical protein [Bradyrhizobium sp. WYCCWR 12677]